MESTKQELLSLVKRINYAFYVNGTAKALRPVMAETKALIDKAEAEIKASSA